MDPSKTSQAVTKRDAPSGLMAPPPPPKRIKRPAIVLEEDEYVNGLDHIIARDFFPGLAETRAQQEYLEALDSKDKSRINEAGKKLTEMMTPGPEGRRMRGRRGVSMTPSWSGMAGATPSQFGADTPASSVADSEAAEERAKPEVDLNMSLSKFQSKYNSEDNESFNKLLDKQNARNRERHAYLWNGNLVPSNRRLAQEAQKARLLEDAAKRGSSSKALVVADTRKAMPDHKPAQPRNSLMFIPDSVEDTHQTPAQAAEAASLMPPKSLVYDNTRMPQPPTEPERPPSPTMSAVDAAIAGRPRGTDTDPGYTGADVPQVNGYEFVDAEPEPGEGTMPDLLAPLRSSTTDGGKNPFTIKEASKREALHHRLVEKAAKSKRASASGAGNSRLNELKGAASSTPRFLSSPVVKSKANLTPAGQRLLDRISSTPRRSNFGSAFGDGGGGGGGQAVRKRGWTPLGTPRIVKK